MTDTAFLDRASLPRPDVTDEQAARILSEHYGLTGDIKELGSQQDRNFRIDTGSTRHVLKLCWAAYDRGELDVQNASMLHVAGKHGAPLVPRPHPSLTGEMILPVEIGGQELQARLLDYLEGSPMTGYRHLSPVSVAALGDLAGRLAHALSDFSHPGLARNVQWDLRKADAVIARQMEAISDRAKRARIEAMLAAAMSRIAPLAADLRLQAVHHDVTDDNVVSHPDDHGRPIPHGVIDFGDITTGWLVADLASTCTALLHHSGSDPFDILPAIKAYHAAHPLNTREVAALWPLIMLRAAGLVAANEQQLAVEPDNAYVLANAAHEWTIMAVAETTPAPLIEAAIHQALGFPLPGHPMPAMGPLFAGQQGLRPALVDLSVLSDRHDQGNWLKTDAAGKLLADTAAAHDAAFARYGEYRLTESRIHSPQESATFALFAELRFKTARTVLAPFAGRLDHADGQPAFVGEHWSVILAGLEAERGLPERIGTGTIIGTATHLSVQLNSHPGLAPPAFATPNRAAAWSLICPSPTTLLGFDCDAPAPDPDGLLATRKRHFAKPQKNYYANPPQIERGWRQHMFDVTGRSFLDMVNNVTILGHGHPRLADAVSRQWRMLNTNSRFHYAAVAEFSERLAKLAPEGLDTVFLVNSGSEANDLALRLAWAHTGARNMLCLLEAYHGWSVASDAVSTSIADNPRALETRPPWVHAVMSPHTYRGLYRGADTTALYLSHVTPVLDAIDASGEGLAGFIAESVYGNAGGIALPDGYLKGMFDMVRARGGVCIADEVQVGYGRLGHHFWGFEQQGVVPDIISIAKGMGNGHPMGAVITTRAIADSLEKEGYFFSSAGGSPVSSVVGNTVLDILEDEGLQANARIVGDHLKARLEALGQRFDLVGAVHGMGLYLGLEFVRDRTSLAPATLETARICDRLMELGVIMQPTGDYLNVLKIKPPMCLSMESADYFADMLARVLAEGV